MMCQVQPEAMVSETFFPTQLHYQCVQPPHRERQIAGSRILFSVLLQKSASTCTCHQSVMRGETECDLGAQGVNGFAVCKNVGCS